MHPFADIALYSAAHPFPVSEVRVSSARRQMVLQWSGQYSDCAGIYNTSVEEVAVHVATFTCSVPLAIHYRFPTEVSLKWHMMCTRNNTVPPHAPAISKWYANSGRLACLLLRTSSQQLVCSKL